MKPIALPTKEHVELLARLAAGHKGVDKSIKEEAGRLKAELRRAWLVAQLTSLLNSIGLWILDCGLPAPD